MGAGALSDIELLAMLLRSGTRGHDVLTLSERLINEAGSLAGCGLERGGLPPAQRHWARQGAATSDRDEVARRVLGSRPAKHPCSTGRISSPRISILTSRADRGEIMGAVPQPKRRSSNAWSYVGDGHGQSRASARGFSGGDPPGGQRGRGGPQSSQRRSDAQQRRPPGDAATPRRCAHGGNRAGGPCDLGRPEADPAARGWFSFRLAGLLVAGSPGFISETKHPDPWIRAGPSPYFVAAVYDRRRGPGLVAALARVVIGPIS